jgi:hypothetical protein
MEDIGANAGKVWQFLKEKGPKPIAHVAKGAGLKRASFDRAIGWLAREDKIRIIEGKPNKKLISLK